MQMFTLHYWPFLSPFLALEWEFKTKSTELILDDDNNKRTLVIWWIKMSQHHLSTLPSCPCLAFKSVQSISSLSRAHLLGAGSISYSFERFLFFFFFFLCQTRSSWLEPRAGTSQACGWGYAVQRQWMNEGLLGVCGALKMNSFWRDQINLI